MLFDALFAAKEDVAIPQVLLLTILDSTQTDLSWDVVVAGRVSRCLHLGIGSL